MSNQKLTKRQSLLLSELDLVWRVAPFRTKAATLLSLSERGLIEGRRTPGRLSFLESRYASGDFQWRRKLSEKKPAKRPFESKIFNPNFDAARNTY